MLVRLLNRQRMLQVLAQAGHSRRLGGVDTARGAAMLFVCLSHFADAYFQPLGYGRTYELIDRLVMIASPTFMMMSGAMLGLLLARRPQDFAALRAKFIDRGVFLLTVAHLLIMVAHVPLLHSARAALRWGFITDAIGAASVLGALLVATLRPARRVLWGVTIYVVSWVAVYVWQPATPVVRLLKDALVGPNAENSWAYVFPILPWFGVYFACTAIGAWLARRTDDEAGAEVPRVCAVVGAAAIALAVAARVGTGLLTAAGWLSPAVSAQAHELTSTWHKIPPGPVYLLAYGGAGLLLVGVCFTALAQPRWGRVVAALQLLGRNSLFVFVLQYYLYFTAMYLLHLTYTPFWPLYFFASLVLLFPLVRVWETRGGNRLITVGLAPRGR